MSPLLTTLPQAYLPCDFRTHTLYTQGMHIKFKVKVLSKQMNKNKRKYQSYKAQDLQSAIAMVQAGEATQRVAARLFQLPQATLSDHLRGRTKPGTAVIYIYDIYMFILAVTSVLLLSVFIVHSCFLLPFN